MAMKYYVSFQYRPRNAARPEYEPVIQEISGKGGEHIPLTSIGDHVIFIQSNGKKVEGVVENRLFMYPVPGVCMINIVVTDSDTDQARLIKE